MTTATITTIMETMKLLSDQVKELSTKKTTAGNKAPIPKATLKPSKPSAPNVNSKQKQALLLDTWVSGYQGPHKRNLQDSCQKHKKAATYNNHMGGINAGCL